MTELKTTPLSIIKPSLAIEMLKNFFNTISKIQNINYKKNVGELYYKLLQISIENPNKIQWAILET